MSNEADWLNVELPSNRRWIIPSLVCRPRSFNGLMKSFSVTTSAVNSETTWENSSAPRFLMPRNSCTKWRAPSSFIAPKHALRRFVRTAWTGICTPVIGSSHTKCHAPPNPILAANSRGTNLVILEALCRQSLANPCVLAQESNYTWYSLLGNVHWVSPSYQHLLYERRLAGKMVIVGISNRMPRTTLAYCQNLLGTPGATVCICCSVRAGYLLQYHSRFLQVESENGVVPSPGPEIWPGRFRKRSLESPLASIDDQVA